MSLTDRLKRRRQAQLNETQVASPCRAEWALMAGDDKVRFCQGCQLHVYNLSAMDVEEAADLIASHDGQLCVRFYRRLDGTVLTRDCPVGVEEARRRGKSRRQDLAAATGFVALASILLMPLQGATARPAAQATALYSVIKQEDVASLRKYLDAGIDPDVSTTSGTTALMAAAKWGRVKSLRLLLKRGANVHARDRQGRTALALAKAQGHRRVVVLLEKAGARE